MKDFEIKVVFRDGTSGLWEIDDYNIEDGFLHLFIDLDKNEQVWFPIEVIKEIWRYR